MGVAAVTAVVEGSDNGIGTSTSSFVVTKAVVTLEMAVAAILKIWVAEVPAQWLEVIVW